MNKQDLTLAGVPRERQSCEPGLPAPYSCLRNLLYSLLPVFKTRGRAVCTDLEPTVQPQLALNMRFPWPWVPVPHFRLFQLTEGTTDLRADRSSQ